MSRLIAGVLILPLVLLLSGIQPSDSAQQLLKHPSNYAFFITDTDPSDNPVLPTQSGRHIFLPSAHPEGRYTSPYRSFRDLSSILIRAPPVYL